MNYTVVKSIGRKLDSHNALLIEKIALREGRTGRMKAVFGQKALIQKQLPEASFSTTGERKCITNFDGFRKQGCIACPPGEHEVAV